MRVEISEKIKYIGVDDTTLDLFESQYVIPDGVSYNSYVILDEKVAVMDTIDASKTAEWLRNVEKALADRLPDYLVVQHMEPDHAASVEAFVNQYPNVTVVGNAKTFVMIGQFFPNLKLGSTLNVENFGTLSLGAHTLTFAFAPMVHWPEVMMTYDSYDKVLFSADGFGKFGANDVEDPEGWACEARRYYFGIVGKYGMQTQNLLKKASGLDIQIICPLHGPVLSENLGYYIDLYDKWSAYTPEEKGVLIAYTSVYGNTKKAVLKLAERLKANGCPKVVVNDLARCDMAEAVEDAFRMGTLVLAAASYDGDVFPPMHEFLHHLQLKGFRSRRVAIIENGSWAPCAGRQMHEMLSQMKQVEIVEPMVTLWSRMKRSDEAALEALAEALLAK